jgi:glutaredoxin
MTEKKTNNTRSLVILGVVIALIIVGLVLTSNKNLLSKNKTISPAQAKSKTESFIKDYLLSADTKFTLGEPKVYNAGLYEIEVTIDGGTKPIKAYMSKDGKIFFPQAMDIEELSKTKDGTANNTDTATAAKEPVKNAPKSDKPVVELFVMSHCPYGTQIEKGLVPVMQALGSKADIQIKFVDYAMHGKKELDEQMSQYCINKEQGSKYVSYLSCFLKAGDSSACLKENNVDEKKLSACVSATDKQYKISEVFAKGESAWGSTFPPFDIYKAENTKYGVQGSPTLVINGEQINSGRDAASLAGAICGAFTDGKKPAECDGQFDSATPAPGFGTGTQASGSNTAANCAPTN